MLSIWERQSFLHADIIIIGGGILGLSTACSIKEQHPERSVLVLERGIFPAGASTKNAGFACFGSLTELVADAAVLGEAKMLELVEKRWRGLALLDQRLGEEAMDYQHHGGFELLTEAQMGIHKHTDLINQLLFSLFQMEVFHSAPSKITEFGFNKEIVKDIVFNPFEAQLDTGKMMKALIAKTHSLGVEILTGAEVDAVHATGVRVEVEVRDGQNHLQFTANRVAVCTNAFLPRLFPQMNVRPGRGQVLITKPIPNLRLKGTFHYDEGFYYFRNYNGRVLFGGGRNLDLDTEATTEFERNEFILNDLKEKLATIILPNIPHEIDYTWQGIMGFGPLKFPFIEMPQPNVFAALGCNGMGVALSSLLGEELAEMITGN
ncbi:MAG: FAD-binding oxidoreductase [Bacteriovoracaceae bacterium]|nr:FAD-binding oxidoreductase [Bacteroidota bacterium]